MKVLGLVGSLRVGSHNHTLLRAIQQLVPEGSSMEIFDNLGDLPPFAPDRLYPAAALRLQLAIETADVVLIASPEYAHGISGVLKNALDWVVTSNPFYGKPVGVLNAAPISTIAWLALRETIRTMDAQLVDTACVQATFEAPFGGPDLDVEALVKHPHTAPVLRQILIDLAFHLENREPLS